MGLAPSAHGAAGPDAASGEDADARLTACPVCVSRAHAPLAPGASVARHQSEDAPADSERNATADVGHGAESARHAGGAQPIHPGRSALLLAGPSPPGEQPGP